MGQPFNSSSRSFFDTSADSAAGGGVRRVRHFSCSIADGTSRPECRRPNGSGLIRQRKSRPGIFGMFLFCRDGSVGRTSRSSIAHVPLRKEKEF